MYVPEKKIVESRTAGGWLEEAEAAGPMSNTVLAPDVAGATVRAKALVMEKSYLEDQFGIDLESVLDDFMDETVFYEEFGEEFGDLAKDLGVSSLQLSQMAFLIEHFQNTTDVHQWFIEEYMSGGTGLPVEKVRECVTALQGFLVEQELGELGE